jgi:transposase
MSPASLLLYFAAGSTRYQSHVGTLLVLADQRPLRMTLTSMVCPAQRNECKGTSRFLVTASSAKIELRKSQSETFGRRSPMNEITRVGVDLAKRVIQVCAVNAAGVRVVNRALPRDKFMPWCAQLPAGCMVAMEASSGAHHWARKLVALGLDARIIAAHLVVPYRLQGKSGKNDANDAAAICEAASRPQMHFVSIKNVEQQSMLCVHRLREGFKQERIACINRIRGLLAEFGLVFAQSPDALRRALPEAMEDASNELGGLARLALQQAFAQWRELDAHLR